MNIEKLKDALAELKHDRLIIDEAIASLEKSIAALSGVADSEPQRTAPSQSAPQLVSIGHSGRYGQRSYVDDSVTLIEQAGHPIHARDLAEGLSRLRGREIKRSALESTLIRHVIDLKERARLSKTGPSTFGIPDRAAVLFTLADTMSG